MATDGLIGMNFIPLDQAQRMGRAPRMPADLYDALRTRIASLDAQAVRITLPQDASLATMKNRILRVAEELRVPVTIRKVFGGLLFWRSTDEDIHQAHEIASRLQRARRSPQTRTRGRWPRTSR